MVWVAVPLLLVFYESHADVDTTAIGYGDCVNALIYPVGEIDAYQFDAAAGDIVKIRMAEGETQIEPRIQFYDSAGILIDYHWSNSLASLDTIYISEPGSYTILAMDDGDDDTGGYSICLQRTFNPPNAIPIIYNTALEGEFNDPAQMDAVTFLGTTGDIIIIRMVDTSGELEPMVELYDSLGYLIDSNWGESVSRIDTLILDRSGNFTLLLMDDDGCDTGTYGLCLQRTFDTPRATLIDYGTTVSDTLGFASEMDAFEFTGNVDDFVIIQMGELSSSLVPRLELYDPTGDWLVTESADHYTRIEIQNLPAMGAYTIFTALPVTAPSRPLNS
jgi:hypothetical protein